jgi:hypothetical protein
MHQEDAMEETWGTQQGTILSCVPGKLAFFKEQRCTVNASSSVHSFGQCASKHRFAGHT